MNLDPGVNSRSKYKNLAVIYRNFDEIANCGHVRVTASRFYRNK